jgi:uncharacterized repeat protein (TIGR01451 family)
MQTQKIWRGVGLVVVMAMLLALVPGFTSAQEPAAVPQAQPQQGLVSQSKVNPKASMPLTGRTSEQDLAKLYPSLRELVQKGFETLPGEVGSIESTATNQPIIVNIVAVVDTPSQAAPSGGEVDQNKPQDKGLVEALRPYFVEGKLYAQRPTGKTEPQGEPQGRLNLQMLTGLILPSNLMKVASNPLVKSILPATPERQEFEQVPADDSQPARLAPGPDDWAALRENAEALRADSKPWSEAKAFGDGRAMPAPQDWYEVTPEGPHKAQAAWERGYRGEGVAVAVIDDGVDMAHPDLMGTQRIYNSVVAPQYNGWPMVMDPFTMRAYFYDLLFGTTYVSGSFGGTTYVDTSAKPAVTPVGSGVSTFKYRPMIDYNVPGLLHTYYIANSMTKSGVVHVGTHTDESLRDYVWGEKVAVLVCDPHVAGVYDTVYVDLDDDYDFRDEKPLTKATVGNPATYNNMIAYRDMNGDGKADLSGGMLYWIADGVNWVPGMDWLFVPTLGFGLTPPAAGNLIAIHGPWDSGYSHGTQCASNVVAQGNIDGMLPKFSDLPGDGYPAAAVYGAAPNADLVPMNSAWSFSGRITYDDAYMLAAVGWDGVDQTGWHMLYGPGYTDTDAIQITSNSYGWSGDDNDGWDFLGQYIWQIQRYYAPYLQFLFSTGNGAPGYGTAAPPSPGMGVAVGSSTEYGSTGWDTITDTAQINFNDYTAFSNSGPGARAGAGVDVLADGSYAAGDEELNYYAISTWGVLDGNISWATWGGTSRSSPTAMGNFALIYQAYKAKHGVWPTADQARALLMSTATDINNDVFRQGAGSVNADRGTLVAAGDYGVYMDGDSATWEPGDYRGTLYPGFAQVVQPGDTWNKTFTVHNDSAAPITVGIADQTLTLIDSEEMDFTVTPQMTQQESVFGAANSDNFYKAFQYMIPITAAAGMDASMYNVAIPAGTDLMVVRQIFPYDEFDVSGDYVYDQRYYLMVYNWKDVNGNGRVWTDKNANGVVNFINGTEWTSVDVGPELLWNDPRTELDRWEYERFGYNRPTANSNELTVQDPLNRMHDGMFIGLRHLFTTAGANVTTHLKYRIEFYKKADVPWLSTDVSSLVVPAGGTATFQGTVNLPGDMPPGDYEAAIEVTDPGEVGVAGPHTSVIPVAINVAASYDGNGALTLAGEDSYAYDADKPYNNAAVRGYQDWGWREESGDWRFFYLDVENECLTWLPPVTFLTENFDGVTTPALPAGWAQADVSDTTGDWTTNVGTWHPSGNPAHSAPNLAVFNSYTASSGASTRLYTTSGLNLSTATVPVMTFWMYHDTGYSSSNDRVQPQVSTDGGTNWTDVGTAVSRVDGTTGWSQETVDLSAYAGQANVQIGFLGTSAYGNDCHIDDVVVAQTVDVCLEYAFPPDAHILVRDVWDDAAPHTDIDTVVLGPTPTGLSDTSFGAWAGDWSEPPFFGPYTLDTIAKSVVDRIGRATWRFNTTSGANEEWVMFPAASESDPYGGLHELLQHNVLFEGDKFSAVFTKTVGMLMEDQHDFEISTYVDQGVVGQVTLTPTLELNGLSATAYLVGTDETDFLDEPLPFAGPGHIEWTNEFMVEDAVSIELWTSSADVPDLDLFLFQWTGTGWAQRASSAGVDANEHIFYTNPADGRWLVGIDNYSGPAGTFDLVRVVKSRVPGISVTGGTANPVPADTPTTLTVRYDYPMEAGQTYDGMVLVGPPEAPQLKQIPITIHRLEESAGIGKKVDQPVTFPGNELKYTINLYNLSDPAAYFEFMDSIPPNTEFVTVTNATYDPAGKKVFYTGPLPIGGPPPSFEGFEGGVMPPDDWSVEHLGATTWEWTVLDASTGRVRTGNWAAWIRYDSTAASDEWLYSPWFEVTDNEGTFWASSDTLYPGATMKVWAVMPDGSKDELWDMIADETWTTFEYREVTVDVSAYLGQKIQLAWQYVGFDGESFGLDDIDLPGMLDVPPIPSRVIELTVMVTDTVAPGTWITNTGSLVATHDMPNEKQVEPTATASAASQISTGPNLATSYKVATEMVAGGGEIDYEVHVINTGTELAAITLTDPIPAGTTYAWHDFDPPYQHFAYDAYMDEMTWTGNVAPGEEWVFSFGVSVGNTPALWLADVENVATIEWNGTTITLTATTDVVAPVYRYFPFVTKNAGP